MFILRAALQQLLTPMREPLQNYALNFRRCTCASAPHFRIRLIKRRALRMSHGASPLSSFGADLSSSPSLNSWAKSHSVLIKGESPSTSDNNPRIVGRKYHPVILSALSAESVLSIHHCTIPHHLSCSRLRSDLISSRTFRRYSRQAMKPATAATAVGIRRTTASCQLIPARPSLEWSGHGPWR